MINANDKADVHRILNNFARVPGWNATMNSDQVDYLFQNHSDTIFCRGYLRRIVAKSITNKTYTVKTEPFL